MKFVNTIMKHRGWIPDFKQREFYFGEVIVDGEKIVEIKSHKDEKTSFEDGDIYILPGLVDAHVHIESSMLTPSQFSLEVIKYGTVATISDPHEIANVLGEEGIRFMFEDAERTSLKIYFTAPSCVPATPLEKSGAVLGADQIQGMAKEFSFIALGEMMNFPGVLNGDEEVFAKIDIFKKLGKPVDGHAPGISGEELRKYAGAGISTDHEATKLEEGREKIRAGMKIQIREGSAAKNFESLWPLIAEYPDKVMLCCDDIHPDELVENHLDRLIRRGLAKGLNIFDLLRAASINTIEHYGLDVGRLRKGEKADFILVGNLDRFDVLETIINGKTVYSKEKGPMVFTGKSLPAPNRFNRGMVKDEDFNIYGADGSYRVIAAIDGDLYTRSETHEFKAKGGMLESDIERDIIKIAVVNRYSDEPPAIGWIKNTGLREGAIASSIAHDSHNIIAMGTNSREIANAVNLIIENQGGISAWSDKGKDVLPLPVAGLMSMKGAAEVGKKYNSLSRMAREMGSVLSAPFMTLSFMALLVIPELKIGDRGLFDVKEFKFVEAKEETDK